MELIMKLEISLSIPTESGNAQLTQCHIDIADCPDLTAMGLSLADSKSVLGWIQSTIVNHQIRAMNLKHRGCPSCGLARELKGYRCVRYRSLFGDVRARVAHWRACSCGVQGTDSKAVVRQSWINAEMQYVHAELGATVPYARAVELLKLVLPTGTPAISTVRAHVISAGARLAIEGLSPASDANPIAASSPTVGVIQPDEPLFIGLDGGYVRHCHPERCDTRYRTIGVPDFEVIAGRLLGDRISVRSIAMVRTIDDRSAQRVQVAIANAGSGRRVEVFTDGDPKLRQWQMLAVPHASHILDWYHLRKRVEILDKVLHRKDTAKLLKSRDHDVLSGLFGHSLWRLWHGQYQEVIRRLQLMLQIFKRILGRGRCKPKPSVVSTLATDLLKYLQHNVDSLPDYGLRWRNGQRISSAFVESAVNQIIDKRMSKSQQMRWDPKSAHELLQVRVRVIDGLLRDDFARWYPAFPANQSSMVIVA
jgi:hypothetical protein